MHSRNWTDASGAAGASPADAAGADEAPTDHANTAADGEIEVTFVVPCLNEAPTLSACLAGMRRAATAGRFSYEMIVADNGSTDGSAELAVAAGASVVRVAARGYGHALAGGIDAARGRIIVMGDADLSYDFADAACMVKLVWEGADLVIGNRLAGRIEPGAMPWKHRFVGTPVLSVLGRVLFGSTVGDVNCGLRTFHRDAYRRLGLRARGMELASEMMVKAALRGFVIREIPVSYRRDGRSRPPHLRPWRDGWRHLRLMLLLCPWSTLAIPGLVPFLSGAAGLVALLYGPITLGAATFDVHTMVVASLATSIGYQILLLAVAVRTYVLAEELGPASRIIRAVAKGITLERGLVFGALLLLLGMGVIGTIAAGWAGSGFGPLDVRQTLRPTIAGATLAAMGFQTALTAFVCGMLRVSSKADGDESPDD